MRTCIDDIAVGDVIIPVGGFLCESWFFVEKIKNKERWDILVCTMTDGVMYWDNYPVGFTFNETVEILKLCPR